LLFVPVTQLRELLDLPPRLVGVQDIPDSVEVLCLSSIFQRPCFRAVKFGRESRLVEIKRPSAEITSARRCFLGVSSASLKVLRLNLEFRED
jgi:hypothetical protein